ncbi:MAG TPA: diguanylate cyclase [Vicinamibacteria bacterium]|nr:diguanylate cyclase [Vicinamibacteria bacterium]
MRRPGEPPAAVVLAVSAVLVVAVAGIDYATGTELRVFPLYFIPVLAVSLRLGRWPGLGTAAACALAWELSNHLAGMRGGRSAIDLANLVVMAMALGSVALLAAAQRGWRAISRMDGLTGLLNGRGFYATAAFELARSSRYRHPLTIAYVDLDDFKSINDRFGHSRGDEVLVAVAHAIRKACRSTDIVGRVGGDEFVVLFPETGRDAAETALLKLRSRIEEVASQHGSRVTASVGSVSFAKPPADVEVLVHEADTVMYAVKAGGKNALRCVEASTAAG